MTRPVEELPGARPEFAQTQQEMLEDVREEIIRLLAELPRMPSALRVQAASVTVELTWDGGMPAEPDGPPGPAHAVTGPGDGDDAMHYVCAPMVGVFYRASQPGAKPFVAEGDPVSAGEQVAIIEAMKLFLPVEADRGGRIARILVADGTSVEFGDRLIAIEDIES